jgi:hypothetical protein
MTTQTDDLLTYLFDGGSNLLLQPMGTWLTSSRRFAAFATTFRDKIRKKIRTTQDRKGLLDLQLELETAYLLLQERALSVAYEPEHSKGIRSPDFAVTFTSSLTFMVEATRVQADLKNMAGESREQPPAPPPATLPAIPPLGTRLADAVVSKLGQLLPRRGNVLLVAVEAAHLMPGDIRNAMLGIQQRVERNDSTVLQGYGFLDRADFFRHYQRLSEILVRVPHADAANSMVTWINPQAKHPLPGRVRTVLYRSFTG